MSKAGLCLFDFSVWRGGAQGRRAVTTTGPGCATRTKGDVRDGGGGDCGRGGGRGLYLAIGFNAWWDAPVFFPTRGALRFVAARA